MRRLYLIPVFGMVLAPLVTWLPMLALAVPSLGLPAYPPALGIDLWHMQAFWLTVLLALALQIAVQDRWLGLAVALAGLTIFLRGAALDPTHAAMFALGAWLLWIARQIPATFHPVVRSVLVGLGLFQAVYVIQQEVLRYDLLWGPLLGGTLVARVQPLGTLGTVDAAAAYIAIIGPIVPVVLLPVIVLAILCTQSMGGALALAVGLAVRFRRALPLSAWAALAFAGGVGVLAIAWLKDNRALASIQGRLAMWPVGLEHGLRSDPVFGLGLGGWARDIPAIQARTRYLPTNELWREAHSEYIQWIVEAGLVGLVILAAWLWTHRAMFSTVWAGALAALAVETGTFFPFHVASTALLAIVLIGLATAPPVETPLAVGG